MNLDEEPVISNFEYIDDDEHDIKFTLNRCPSRIANGLRRVLIAETPTLAFELVDMNENSRLEKKRFHFIHTFLT